MSDKAYPVTPEWASRAWLDDAKYKTLYDRSVNDPEGFWAENGRRIDWIKPYYKVKNTSFDPGTMVRLVVPGWAHMYRGMRERGVLYLAAYFGCLLPGLILLGSWLGSVCIGLAFGIHVMSAVDAMVGQFSDFAGRIAFSLFCGLGLLAVVYLPIGYAISRVATPIQVTQPGSTR